MNDENIKYQDDTFSKLLHDIEEDNFEKIKSDKDALEALRELNDVKAALRCDAAPEVDLEAELKTVTSKLTRYNEKASPVHRFSWKYAIACTLAGIVIGGAAVFAILFSTNGLGSDIQNDAEGVTLYSALEYPGEITVSDIPKGNAMAQNDNPETLPATTQPVQSTNAKTAQPTDGIEVLDMRLAKGSAMEERIVTTPVGKNLRIILADGTEVLLNDNSTLRFPIVFSQDTRTVHLEGEAYFKVAKDKKHPFNVMTRELCTTALGTEFDVNAYRRTDEKVSLIEGSVLVESLLDKASVVLKPGEDVTSVDGKMRVSAIDVKAFKYWRDGYFYFEDAPLADMMIELGRWYNVSVELTDRSLMSYKLHFVSARNESINDVIKRLNKFSYLDLKFDDNKITISERQ